MLSNTIRVTCRIEIWKIRSVESEFTLLKDPESELTNSKQPKSKSLNLLMSKSDSDSEFVVGVIVNVTAPFVINWILKFPFQTDSVDDKYNGRKSIKTAVGIAFLHPPVKLSINNKKYRIEELITNQPLSTLSRWHFSPAIFNQLQVHQLPMALSWPVPVGTISGNGAAARELRLIEQ